MITREHIWNWLQNAKDEKATHVVIRSDSFSHEYYPVSCHSVAHAKAVAGKAGNMQATIEVYDLSKDWDDQLDTPRCWNI